MIRNLKRLGLAIGVMLALGAMGGTAASASEIHSEVASTKLSGTQPAAYNNKWTFDVGTAECKNETYSGTMTGTTTTTVALTPSFSECTGFAVKVTIDVNGCEYVFHTNPASWDVVCGSGRVIEFTSGAAPVKRFR